MRFSKFYFENFRGIEKLEIAVTDKNKPICLLGLNESGKTTTLQAIHMLGELVRGGTLENGRRLSMRPKATDFTGTILLKGFLDFEKENIEKLNAIEILRKTLTMSKVKSIEHYFTYEFQNNKFVGSQSWIRGTSWKKNITDEEKDEGVTAMFAFIKQHAPDILYYEDFVFDVPDNIVFHDNSEGDTNINKDWQNIFNDIYLSTLGNKQEKDETLFENEIVNWIDENPEDRNTVESRLLRMSNKLNDTISKKWRDISKKKSSFQSIKIEHKNDFQEFRISLESKNNIYKVHERSKGFKWFFTFLILTEFRKHRNKNTIFLLDEPASNLHASAQEQISIALKKLCNDATVIYSTHSPYLLDSTNIRNTYLAKGQESEFGEPIIICQPIETQVQDLEKNPQKTLEYIKPLLDHIAFSLPQILVEPEIVKLIEENRDISKKDIKALLEKTQKVLSAGSAKILKSLPVNLISGLILRIFLGG